jgi:hypothetical protein
MAFLRSAERFSARLRPPLDPPRRPSATAIGFFTLTGVGNVRTRVSDDNRSVLRRLGTV